jgi:hypothetical protein
LTHSQLTELRKRALPRYFSLALEAAADARRSPSGPVDGFSAGLKDDDNLYEWEIMIIGPNGEWRTGSSPLECPADALRSMLADTLYEGGFLRAELVFPPEYPLLPPKMKFITPMWHPNGESACDRSYSAGGSSHSAPLQSTPTATCASPFWCVACTPFAAAGRSLSAQAPLTPLPCLAACSGNGRVRLRRCGRALDACAHGREHRESSLAEWRLAGLVDLMRRRESRRMCRMDRMVEAWKGVGYELEPH